MKNKILLFIFLFITTFSIAQSYSGSVLDEKTNEALVGVTVYFDGTTIGVITNPDGVFKIEVEESINAPLVLSYLGYETKIIDKSTLLSSPIIKMKEKLTPLDEVVISDDDWSREKKLGYFRREFLGKTKQTKDCKILNEDKIRLRYSKVDNTLYAVADEPIIIKNKFLGYTIEYNLIDFEINFKNTLSGLRMIDKVFFSGTNIYKELNKKKTKKRYIKNREQVYTTSLLYFMRSLANNTLKENNFRLFIKDPSGKSKLFFETIQSNVFKTEKIKDFGTKVTLLDNQKIIVRLENLNQAQLFTTTTDSSFYIDDFGIHFPIESLFFGGAFGDNRMATMLPSDYKLKEK